MHKEREQTLALAGVAQFTWYAHQLAASGVLAPVRLQRALEAIYCTDPDSADDIFNGIGGVADGRRFLSEQLQGAQTDKHAGLVSRYIGQILRLSARLLKDPQSLQKISDAIAQARLLESTQAPSILAEAYKQTLSKLRPRILIQGKQETLAVPENSDKIRTLLLAAVRCAILWRQSGGSLWRLVLKRKQLAAALAGLNQEPANATQLSKEDFK